MQTKEIRERLTDNQIYLGIDVDDLRIFDAYKDPAARPQSGFYTDFSGVKTRLSYFGMESHPGEKQVGAIPFPDDGLHAETIEYLAAITAVDSAKDSFTAVELGAGYGPWIVFSANAARAKKIPHIKLLAVEADRQRHALMRTNLTDNHLPAPADDGTAEHDGVSVKLIYGAISDSDGTISFGSQNITDWGAAGIEDGGNVDYRGAHVQTDLVNTYKIESVLRDVDLVDFMHIDIQGFEYRSVKASLDALQRKVRVLLIATHSRKIEGELIALLYSNGWHLKYEKPCKFNSGEAKDLTALTYLDGTQVWINTALGQPAKVTDDIQALRASHEAKTHALLTQAKAEHLSQMQRAEDAHRAQMDAMVNSTSWKISAPIRWIKSMLS